MLAEINPGRATGAQNRQGSLKEDTPFFRHDLSIVDS